MTLPIYLLFIHKYTSNNYKTGRLIIALCLLFIIGIRVSELLSLKVSQIKTLIHNYSSVQQPKFITFQLLLQVQIMTGILSRVILGFLIILFHYYQFLYIFILLDISNHIFYSRLLLLQALFQSLFFQFMRYIILVFFLFPIFNYTQFLYIQLHLYHLTSSFSLFFLQQIVIRLYPLLGSLQSPN